MTNLTDLELAELYVNVAHATPSWVTGLAARALVELRELRDENERLRAMYVGEHHQDDCLAYLEADYGVDYECSCGQSARLKDGDA